MAVFPLRYLRLRGKDNDDIIRRLSESGVIWYNTNKKTLNVMDGTTKGGFALAREDLSNVTTASFLAKLTEAGGGAGGSASITLSDTPPTEDLESGYIWLNTTNGKLYVYYYDGSSFQWVQPSQASWLTGPTGGGTGSGTVNPSTLEGRLAYYASPGDAVDDLAEVTWLSNEFKIDGKIHVTGQKNLIRFHWDSLADLAAEVNPVTWHGMIAHCHQEGRIYYAHSGQWTPVPIASDIPAQYSLPAASSSTRGGVIIPNVATSGLNNSSGTISLATASTTQKGGVIVDGTTITINAGVISAVTSSGSSISVSSVSPPSPDVGSGWLDSNTGNFLIYSGNEWIQPSSPTYTLPTSSNTVLGGVKIDGTTISISNGVISVVNPFVGNTANIVITDGEQTLTNKTINLSNTTFSGTLAQFNTALSDANFVSIAGTETLTNKTLTAPTINTPTIDTPTITNGSLTGVDISNSSTISDGTNTYEIGFRNMPQSSNATGTLIASDNGKHLYLASNITVPPNASVPFPIGTVISIVSNGSAFTIIQGTGVTLKLANTTTTGNRSMAANGLATLLKVAQDTWYITGIGIT